MATPQAQEFTLYAGEDKPIVLTGTDTTDPSSFDMTATFAAYEGGPVLVAVSTPDITVAANADDATVFDITIPLTRVQTGTTLGVGDFFMDLWRTESGFNVRMAGGHVHMLKPVRATA